MARNADLTARIVAEDKASKVIDQVADKAEDLEDRPVTVEVESDVTKALDGLDKLNLEARATAVAAEELGRALGPELAARADMTAVVSELKALGLTAEQVTTNADELAAKLKEVDSPDLGGKLGQALGTARGETEKLADSARGANSAMANMIGNSVQDLGALGGVAGSAGVALGQMAEYAADAKLGGEGLASSLGSMAKVAGPIAGLAFAMQLMGDAMAAAQASRAFDAANTQQYFDALREGTSIVSSFNDEIRETGELQYRSQTGGGFLGMFSSTKDLLPILERTNTEVRDFNQIVDEYVAAGDGSAEANDRWREALEARGVSELDAIAIVKAANQEADARVAATERQQRSAEALGTTVEDLAAAEELAAGVTKAMALAQEEQARAAEEQRRAMEQTALAAQEYATIVRGNDWGRSTLEGATAGAQAFADAQFGLVNIASEAEAAYDALNAAIEANGYTFDLNTDAGRANSAALQDLYQSTIPAMAKAYADAGGDLSTFAANMDGVRQGVMAQLREETSLTEDQIVDLVNQMGLIPENTRSQFEMMGVEDANAKLALLSGVLGSLPADVQRQVTLSILAGDPQAALDAIQSAVGAAPPVEVPSAADMTGAASDVEGWATGDQPEATVPVGTDLGKAETDTAGFRRRTETTVPVVPVQANTNAAVGTMLYLGILAALIRPTVTVSAETSGAEMALGIVARDRDSTIRVGTAGLSGAERAINEVARDRSVTIRPNVVPSSVLVRVDGGG